MKQHQNPCDPLFQLVLLEMVEKLREPPEVRDGEEGPQVRLGGDWYALDMVRQAIAVNEEPYVQLAERGVPFDWLEGMTPPEFHFERTADQDKIDALLEQRAVEATKPLDHLAAVHFEAKVKPAVGAEQLGRILGGAAQSLRATMPRDLRRRGEAVLAVGRLEKEFPCSWVNGALIVAELKGLLARQGQLLANLDHAKAMQAGDLLAESLLEGAVALPGFKTSDFKNGARHFVWRRPMLP